MSLAIAINKRVSCQTAQENEESPRQRRMRYMERTSRKNAEQAEDREVKLHERGFRQRQNINCKGLFPQWNYI